MAEFTSTGLVALLVAAMAAEDPEVMADMTRPDPMRGATLPASAKSALIARCLTRLGPGFLLGVGRYLDRLEDTPALAVLTASPDPAVIAAKWMRLERYHHASHRTRIKAVPGGWDCQRSGRGGPPGLGENCLIAGTLAGLLRVAGVRDCTIHLCGQAVPPGAPVTLLEGERADQFALRWTSSAPAAIPSEGSDRATSDRLTDVLAADIGRSWRVDDAARALAQSRRTLQRRLTSEGRSFSSVLRRARMRRATGLLTGTTISLAEIGYICGYADQAHFQRDFLRVANVTPRCYRELARDG